MAIGSVFAGGGGSQMRMQRTVIVMTDCSEQTTRRMRSSCRIVEDRRHKHLHMATSSSGQTKGQDDFPNGVKVQMKQFHELLGQLRIALKPLSENGACEGGVDRVKQQQQSPLAAAQSDLTTCYAVNSLFWAYLIASGQNPKEHDVKRELSRLKVSMSRLRELSGRETAARSMRLDVPAASRMVKHSLCQAEPADQDDEDDGRKRKKRKT